MTKEEKIIATAFTGRMFIDGSEMGSLYEYMEKKVGHGVIDLMLASKEFWEELHKACEQDFIDMVSKEQPSLPSNLDEAALKAYPKMSRLSEPHGVIPADNKTHYLGDANEENRVAFKAGAGWMAGQGVSVDGLFGIRGVESNNIVDAMLDGGLKMGDKVVVQIRKK